MSSEDDVIDQADALMRRYRSFVAHGADGDAPVAGTDSTADDIDIPMLTDVVDADSLTPENIDEVLTAMKDELREELSAWLVDTLPVAVANASQHILTELDTKARYALLPRLQEIVEMHRGKPRPTAAGDALSDPSV